MRFRDKELRGLPVVTRAGVKVGKIAGIIIDADAHSVAQYVVRRMRLILPFLPQELLVHPSQVVSLDREKMVVSDGAVVEAADVRATAPSPASSPSGVALKE